MNDTEETGPVSVALAHGWKLVNDQPELAREQAGEILKVAPGSREARLLEAVALRQLGDLGQSSASFVLLERDGALWPRAMFEQGLLRYREGRLDDAISLVRVALQKGLKRPNAWRLLGDIATMANGDRFLIRVHSPVPKPNSDGTGIRMTTDYKMRSEVRSYSIRKLFSEK